MNTSFNDRNLISDILRTAERFYIPTSSCIFLIHNFVQFNFISHNLAYINICRLSISGMMIFESNDVNK